MTRLSKPVTKTTAKTSTYSRFIPREEIDNVASWNFSSMESNLAPVQTSQPASEQAEPSAAEIAAGIAAEIANQEAERQQIEAEREQARAEGFAQGREQGEQETRAAMAVPLQQALQANALRIGELLQSMTEQLLTSEEKISRQLLELACDIARQVVRQELTVNTRQLQAVIDEALEMVVDDGLTATVRLHPDDLAPMKDALVETLGENAPEFVADATITPGGCLLHTPSMAVDATVEKRWARAVGNLGLSMGWGGNSHSPIGQPASKPNTAQADDA